MTVKRSPCTRALDSVIVASRARRAAADSHGSRKRFAWTRGIGQTPCGQHSTRSGIRKSQRMAKATAHAQIATITQSRLRNPKLITCSRQASLPGDSRGACSTGWPTPRAVGLNGRVCRAHSLCSGPARGRDRQLHLPRGVIREKHSHTTNGAGTRGGVDRVCTSAYDARLHGN